MSKLDRLKQHLTKASFATEIDRLAAIQCLDDLIEDIETAAEIWAGYVEADHAPMSLLKYLSAAIRKEPT